MDEVGRILYIQRRGNKKWALPAGGIELNESLLECLKREVKEETGLDVVEATLVAMYTGKQYSLTNRYGDEYQGFECLFYVNKWEGRIERETNETLNIGFFLEDELPEFEEGYFMEHEKEVLKDWKNYKGQVIIK